MNSPDLRHRELGIVLQPRKLHREAPCLAENRLPLVMQRFSKLEISEGNA